VPVNSVRNFGIGTNSTDIVLEPASYVPVCFENRPVTDPSNSFSPTSPTSLPMVKANRCSVSIGSARAPPGTSENASNSQHRAIQRCCAAETSRPDVFGTAIESSRPRVGFAALHSNLSKTFHAWRLSMA